MFQAKSNGCLQQLARMCNDKSLNPRKQHRSSANPLGWYYAEQFAILVSVLGSQSAILLESTKESSAPLTRCGC